MSKRKNLIFVSYSRSDVQLATAHVEALRAAGFEVLFDQSRDETFVFSIVPGDVFWERLKSFIAAADQIVFLMSAASLRSFWCEQELLEASRLGKRVIPVTAGSLEGVDIPEALAKIHWLPMLSLTGPTSNTSAKFEELCQVLETDIESVRRHARLASLAEEWHRADCPPDRLLLDPVELASATELLRAGLPEGVGVGFHLAEFLEASAAYDQSERRKLELSFVSPAQRELQNGRFDSALRYAVAGALAGKDASFKLVPELSDIAFEAAVANRVLAHFRDQADKQISAAAMTADGKKIIACSESAIRVWDAQSAEPLSSFAHKCTWPYATFSPDASRVLLFSKVLNEHHATLWDTTNGTELKTFTQHQDTLRMAAFSKDGSLLATASNDGTCRIWNGHSGETTEIVLQPRRAVFSVAFSQDAKLVATGTSDGTCWLWDTTTGRLVWKKRLHQRSVVAITFSADGRYFASGSSDNSVIVWRVDNRRRPRLFRGHKETVGLVQFSCDGTRLVSSSSDGTARVWSANTGRALAVLAGGKSPIHCAAFSPDGLQVAIASDGANIVLWDVKTKSQVTTLSGHDGTVLSVMFTADGRGLLSSALDGSTRLWDVHIDQRIATLRRPTFKAFPKPFSALTQVEFRLVNEELYGHTYRVQLSGRSVEISCAEKVVNAYSSPSGNLILTTDGDPARPGKLRFHVWSSQDGHPINIIRTQWDLLISGDDSVIVSIESDAVWLRDGRTAVKQYSLPHRATAAALSPDCRTVFTTSYDGTMQWSVSDGRRMREISGARSAMYNKQGTRSLFELASGECVVEDEARRAVFSSGLAVALLTKLRRGVDRRTQREGEDPVMAWAPSDLFTDFQRTCSSSDKAFAAKILGGTDFVLDDACYHCNKQCHRTQWGSLQYLRSQHFNAEGWISEYWNFLRIALAVAAVLLPVLFLLIWLVNGTFESLAAQFLGSPQWGLLPGVVIIATLSLLRLTALRRHK